MEPNATLFGQTIAMIVFVWFSMKFIWPVLMNIIEKRRKQIADGIAAGEKGQRELADARQGSEAILQEARQKAVQVVDIAHRRSNELVGEAKHVAIAEGERLITAARSEATNEKQRARDALRKEVAVLIKHFAAGVAPRAMAVGNQLAAAVVLIALLPFFPPLAVPSALVLANVAALALLASGVAFILYFRLIADIGATRALTVTYLIPLFGIFWGWLFLGEALPAAALAGGVLILSGTVLVTRG
jgi:F-type H+-transporting ATPase subunit b